MTSPADAAALLAWAHTQTWAMEEHALTAMTGALVALSRGQTGELGATRHGSPPRRSGERAEAAIAVLPVFGPITYRPGLFSMIFGATTIKGLMRDLQDAMDEPRVRSILMPIDSPGGTVTGLIEVAAALRAARAKKRIVAAVDPFAASAAYWIAASTSEIVSIPSGEVGSVGVFGVHIDESAALEMAGIKTTLITSTPEKAEGNPFEPLSDDARADMQKTVDRVYQAFLSDVARGRGIDVPTVREKFGRGRLIDARRARVNGMVDRIATFDQAVARLSTRPPGAAACSWSPPHPLSTQRNQRHRRLALLKHGLTS